MRSTFVPDNRGTVRGMTLLEMVIAVGLVALVFTLVMGIYVTGLRIWSSHDARSQIIQSVHLANRRIRNSVEASNSAGVSVTDDGRAVSIISTKQDETPARMTEDGKWIWTSWDVYYQEGNTLKFNFQPWLDASESERTTPIDQFFYSETPLEELLGDGRQVVENLYRVEFVPRIAENVLQVDWEFRLQSRGKRHPEKIQSRVLLRFRN